MNPIAWFNSFSLQKAPNLIEERFREIRLNPYLLPCGFLIPFTDTWVNLKNDYTLSNEVKWQIFFAASSHSDICGFPNTNYFFIDHLTPLDLIILYRILISFEKESHEPVLKEHLRVIEKKFIQISLESEEKNQELLGLMREQNDINLNLVTKRLETARSQLIETPLFDRLNEWNIIKKWGLNPLLANTPGLVTFLYETENLRSMATFYGEPSLYNMIPFDQWGNPLLKVEGINYTWNEFKQIFLFNPYSQAVIHRSTGRLYNYMHSQKGFIPYAWLEDNQPRAIHTLNQTERQTLLAHAKKFYNSETPERNPWEEKTCVFQLITVAEEPKNKANQHAMLLLNPPHVAVSLIDEKGEVYSWGLHVDLDWLASGGKTFGTSETKNAFPDIEIFKRGDNRVRRITSVPVTSTVARQLLTEVEELNKKGIRHQTIKQNCGDSALHFLKMAGYEVNCCITFSEYASGLLPSLESIPVLGSALSRIYNLTKRIFIFIGQVIPGAFKSAFRIITFLPSKAVTVFQNLFLLSRGLAKKKTPLQEGIEEEPISNEIGIRNFSSVFRYASDLFNDDIPVIHHSAPIVNWQDQQGSTVEYRYKGTKLCILPA